MAFHRAHRKFGREKNQRAALFKSLAYALATKGKIKTTEAKAKELRPYFEKLVTLGKKQTPASRRVLESRVGVRAGKIIAVDLPKRFDGRDGGYTRITKMARRASDGAQMAYIELV